MQPLFDNEFFDNDNEFPQTVDGWWWYSDFVSFTLLVNVEATEDVQRAGLFWCKWSVKLRHLVVKCCHI